MLVKSVMGGKGRKATFGRRRKKKSKDSVGKKKRGIEACEENRQKRLDEKKGTISTPGGKVRLLQAHPKKSEDCSMKRGRKVLGRTQKGRAINALAIKKRGTGRRRIRKRGSHR